MSGQYFPLPSAYRLMKHLPHEMVVQSRKLVYISVANTIKAARVPGGTRSDFGIACTFALPNETGIDSLLTSIQGVPAHAYGDGNPLSHTINALKMERAMRLTAMGQGFSQTRQNLGPEALLLSVHAVFGLRKPVDIGLENEGALALVHNADGTGGVALVSHAGELIYAQHALPGSSLELHGNQIDLIGDLSELYDILTVSEDELEVLG